VESTLESRGKDEGLRTQDEGLRIKD